MHITIKLLRKICVPKRYHNFNTALKYDPVQLTYMKETCIAVDANDNVVGNVSKEDAHKMPNLVLHRAFSVFAFTPDNKLIMQRRSDSKITFPSLWTNTCCSHPLYNDVELNGLEGVKKASVRKLNHELGISDVHMDEIVPIGRYLYKAEMDFTWGEYELDYVVILKNVDLSRLSPNPNEVSDICCLDLKELSSWVSRSSSDFTPWFLLLQKGHLEAWWQNLRSLTKLDFKSDIIKLTN